MTVHLEIRGKVQEVFFRATARKVAEKNSLRGWIKNKSNGNVEAVVTGKKEEVNTFIDWCKQGPENAIVDDVVIKSLEEITFKKFSVER